MEDLGVSEDVLLNAYGLSTLNPVRWEDDTRERADGAPGASPTPESAPAEPAEEPVDPLGLRPVIAVRNLRPESRGKVAISSKAFDPKVFLNTVHPDASFAELTRGLTNLKGSIAQRSEALKVLVNENFDRFVSVKATTDGVYREMCDASAHGPLAPGADYGVASLRSSLGSASAKADQVFRPVLENNLKVMKLRSTLAVFERSHFFFNLPGSLEENVAAGRYEAALRDYLKGKYLLESRPGQLLPLQPIDSTTGPHISEAQLAQQQRIFKKVWDAVESIMQEMRQKMLAHLRDAQRSVEEQEHIIEVLLELDPESDPVAVFLESQHQHIRSLLRDAFTRELGAVQRSAAAASSRTSGDQPLERARDLHECIALVRTSQGTKPSFPHALGAPVWQAIDDMIGNVCRTVLQTVPTFWRIARDHAKGKFQRSKARNANAPIHEKSRVWAVESIRAFVTRLTEFFELQKLNFDANHAALSRLPSWAPAQCCSLSSTHYMSSILSTLTESVQQLKALQVPDTSAELDVLVFNTRYQFTGVLCYLWLQDAALCRYLETWAPNAQQPATTAYLRLLSVFNRWNAREAFYIADSRVKANTAAHGRAESEIHPAFAKRIGATFVDALTAFLDGIAYVAMLPHDVSELRMAPHRGSAGGEPRDRDTRILLSVSNLTYLRTSIIPAWIRQFQDAYQVSLAKEQATILEACTRRDQELFDDFVQRKSASVMDVIRRGVLESGIDWSNLPKPTHVHPYVYQSLLMLVQVHAQLRMTASQLVPRAITALVELVASVCLSSFTKVPAFNMGGMLQATLEIEFVHQTMAQYVSPHAAATLKRVYETISERYSSSAAGMPGDMNQGQLLQRELEGVKETLVASRRATALEFLCFRRPKGEAESKSPSKAPSKG